MLKSKNIKEKLNYEEKVRVFFYLKMNADGLENLVGCVSREEGHEHVLQKRLLTIDNNQVH